MGEWCGRRGSEEGGSVAPQPLSEPKECCRHLATGSFVSPSVVLRDQRRWNRRALGRLQFAITARCALTFAMHCIEERGLEEVRISLAIKGTGKNSVKHFQIKAPARLFYVRWRSQPSCLFSSKAPATDLVVHF